MNKNFGRGLRERGPLLTGIDLDDESTHARFLEIVDRRISRIPTHAPVVMIRADPRLVERL